MATHKAQEELGPKSKPLTPGQKAVQPKYKLSQGLDETVPGGIYMGEGGEWHDAHGNIVEHGESEAAKVEHNETEVVTPMPVQMHQPVAAPAAKKAAKKK